MIKTFIIKKGSQIVIKEHYWGTFHETFGEVVNTTLDEDITIRCRDVVNRYKLHKILRAKYGLVKNGYNSYSYKYEVNELIERED